MSSFNVAREHVASTVAQIRKGHCPNCGEMSSRIKSARRAREHFTKQPREGRACA
jgi:predicted RNA-binding Zn-ribbon protein involved in translation (DUF1610 family)